MPYTKKQIMDALGASEYHIRMDMRHLGIKPVSKESGGNTKFYSDRDFERISRLRKHCKKGLQRQEYKEDLGKEDIGSVEIIEASKVEVLLD
ncbi:hypothetical protein [Okeania sp. SIO2B9]|uniref:hypothetical protein n=1 Tax=Okeania sp. SIO2B9 TaxID=2607782 RepID=UPI001429DE07|nr:hypothetical protein [Okeania sp. SIO2B9]NES93071.1 hypothetical protein [Okeania sp. SIO2B9]